MRSYSFDDDDEMPTGVGRAPRSPAPAPAARSGATDYAIEYEEWDAEPPTREVPLNSELIADREATVVASAPTTRETTPLDGDATLKAQLLSGGRVGHFTILNHLDQGGMGLIFVAQDDNLGRKVALKLLRSAHAQSEVGRDRLRHEAQALARLAHPNVVTVHEVGEYAGHVYVAMELVEGRTLRAWLKQAPRGWREIVGLFVQAGRGLAAAHDAGIVHRDFKPNNVVVGQDGRARVLDFGLALADEMPLDDAPTGPPPTSGSGFPGGGIAGTPSYMAPEQLLGAETDARADQFAFCVALAEALYGRRPFAGKTLDERRRELTAHAPPDLPRAGKVPGFLRSALLRGLAREPAGRYPSMAALLAAIDRDPLRTRNRILAGVAAGALLLVVGVLIARRDPAASCAAREDPTVGLWKERQEAIHGALTATGVPFAEDTWGRLSPRLDAYATQLREGDQRACAAHHRGEHGDALYGRQLACLGGRRYAFKALTDALAAADAKAVEGAIAGVSELPLLARCDDVAALTAESPPPEDPAVAAELEGLRERLEADRVAVSLRRSDPSITSASELVARARALGLNAFEAEALGILGRLQLIAADYPSAEETLTDAVWAADLVRDDELLAEHLGGLIRVIGHERGRHDDALRWRRHADTVIGRLPPGSRGEARLRAAIGLVLLDTSQVDAALDLFQRSVAILEASDGPEHERVSAALVAVAAAQTRKNDLQAARATYARALAIAEATYGPDHPRVAEILVNLGGVDGVLGDVDAASAHLQKALAIQEAVLGPEHPDLATVVANIGASIATRGDLAGARPYFERALLLEEKARGPDHPALAYTLDDLGTLARDLGDLAAARTRFERSLAIREKALRADDPTLAQSLSLLGGLDLKEGKLRPARTRLGRALSILEARPADAGPERLADARHELARALRVAGSDPERQRELAGLALAGYKEVDPERFKAQIAELEAWLAEEPPPTKGKKKKKKKTKKKKKK